MQHKVNKANVLRTDEMDQWCLRRITNIRIDGTTLSEMMTSVA